jgi:serine/threonine protein phosphatase PrpC
MVCGHAVGDVTIRAIGGRVVVGLWTASSPHRTIARPAPAASAGVRDRAGPHTVVPTVTSNAPSAPDGPGPQPRDTQPRDTQPPTSRKPRDDEIELWGLTHPGKVRATNEDHFLVGSLFKQLSIWATSLPDTDQLRVSNERLGSLAMVADGVGGEAAGEEASRLALEEITELIDMGVMARPAAMASPWAHVLSSSLGGEQTAPAVTRIPATWGDVHLLCSDGLTKHVSDARIAERLASMTSVQQVCEALLQDALDGGGTDNITIIVARAVPKEAR